jgi:hypothetical protein
MKTKLTKYFEFMVEILLVTAMWALTAFTFVAIAAGIYMLFTYKL